MTFHRQTHQIRDGNWGAATVVCICGERITRPTSYEAMKAYDDHNNNRSETVPQPHTAVSDTFRDKGGPGPLGAAYQAVRTHTV